MPEQKFIISTDSSGILGTASKWERVWGPAKQDPQFKGVEAIGWSWFPYQINSYREKEIGVEGIHGRTGGVDDSYGLFDRLKLEFLNRLLLKTDSLLKINHGISYVLVHGPELKSLQKMQLCVANSNLDKIIFVEGHLKPGATDTSRAIARQLRVEGVNAGLMADLCHISLSEVRHVNNYNKAWDYTINIARGNFQEALRSDPDFPIGIHVPIGDGEGLPWGEMDDDKLKDIARLRNEFPQLTTVIESQQKLQDAIFLTNKRADRLRVIHEQRFEKLRKNDVI